MARIRGCTCARGRSGQATHQAARPCPCGGPERAPSMHGRADRDPTTPRAEAPAVACARRTLSRRDPVSRCPCRQGAGGGRRSAAGAGQDRGTGRRRHWLRPPAPAATHWSPRCTIVASWARGRDSQRDPRKTSEKLEGPGCGGSERSRGRGGAWRAGHDRGGASPASLLELGLCAPRTTHKNRFPCLRLEQESCSGPPLL